MRMTSCKQCEDIISTSIDTCENCGALNENKRSGALLGMVTIIVPMIVLLLILKVMIS